MPKAVYHVVVFLLTFQISATLSEGNCSLPDTWRGKWFQSGVLQPVVISSKHISSKGDCYDNQANNYLLQDAANQCHRCVTIYERTPNVLQYKESMCVDQPDLELMCKKILLDASVYALFRMDAIPQDCPFRGAPFVFAYNRGYGDCKSPNSYLDTCASNSRLVFHYQLCADIKRTSNMEEELECFGHWREGPTVYLVGKVQVGPSVSYEDMYRCFAIENTTDDGYRVARSGDATCTGLSPTQGAITFTFTKLHTERCQFPLWLRDHRWQSLDGKNVIRMSPGNYSFDFVSTSSGMTEKDHRSGDLFSSLFSPGTRIHCEEVMQVSSQEMSIQVTYIHQCKRKKICLHFYHRDEDVLEMQGSVRSTECTSTDHDNDTLVTFVNPDAEVRDCPHLGKYPIRGIVDEGPTFRDICGQETTNQSFHALIVCDDQKALKFYSNCNCSQETSQAFACYSSWEEGGNGFVIASPLNPSGIRQRTCFTYSSDPATGMLTVFSSGDACRRSAGPEDAFARDLTVEMGRCAEELISSSSPTTASVSVTSKETTRPINEHTTLILSDARPIIAPVCKLQVHDC